MLSTRSSSGWSLSVFDSHDRVRAWETSSLPVPGSCPGKAERLIVEWCGDSGVIFIEFGAGPRSEVGIQRVTAFIITTVRLH